MVFVLQAELSNLQYEAPNLKGLTWSLSIKKAVVLIWCLYFYHFQDLIVRMLLCGFNLRSAWPS
jgi:hypothetical protein